MGIGTDDAPYPVARAALDAAVSTWVFRWLYVRRGGPKLPSALAGALVGTAVNVACKRVVTRGAD